MSFNKLFLISLIAGAIVNIVLACLGNNNGYEAFVTLTVATTVAITGQTVSLCTALFRTKLWIGFRILLLPFIWFFWFIVLLAAIVAITPNSFAPMANPPDLNWSFIAIGIVVALLPYLFKTREKQSATALSLQWLVSFYSMIIFFLASVTYHSAHAAFPVSVLVIVIQLQYIMSSIIIKTNYPKRSLAIAAQLSGNEALDDETSGKLAVALFSLPFLIPLLITLGILFYSR